MIKMPSEDQQLNIIAQEVIGILLVSLLAVCS